MALVKRIYALLQPDERRRAWRAICTVFFTALLDFAGLASLLPVLYYLLDDGETSQAALFFCLLAVAVILVKCILSTFFVRYQNQCLLSYYRRLSFSLFSSFYNRGLLFIREQGSSKLGHEINNMCYAFSNSLLGSVFRMAGDALLIILVTVALFIWNGKTVLLLFASFIPFMCIYFLVVKRRVQRYGQEDMDAKRQQARVVMDTFRGYVELEVNGAFPTLQASFLEGMDKISHSRLKLDTILRLPLFLSELSVVVGLTLLVFFGEGDVKMLAGIFAVAAFRLLPALRTILTGWTQIQNSICCLDAIEEGLKGYNDDESQNQKDISFEREIIIDNLTYTYPDGETIFKDFNCHIQKGEYVGFRGSSGAGKSTLFNILIGLLKPIAGEIRIDDEILSDITRAAWMRKIGYVPQEVFIFNGSIAENIALGCKEIDYHRVEETLRHVSLNEWIDTIPEGIHGTLSEAGGRLSGGQKQRIGIARALYKQATIILMDEATSALDNKTEQEINKTLRQLKDNYKDLTILSIAHRDSTLEYCDRIITIEK